MKDNDHVYWSVGGRWIDGVKSGKPYLDTSGNESSARAVKIVTRSGSDIKDGTIMNMYLSGAIIHMGHHTFVWAEAYKNKDKNENWSHFRISKNGSGVYMKNGDGF